MAKTNNPIRSIPFTTEALSDLKGCTLDGYTPEDVFRFCSTILLVTGIPLCVVWDVYDNAGYGGSSEFAVYTNGALFEADGLEELSDFLNGEGECPGEIVVTLGDVIETQTDDGSNFARKDSLGSGAKDEAQKVTATDIGAIVKVLGDCVEAHMEDSEPEHAVGDAEDLLRAAMEVMQPHQVRRFLASEAVSDFVENNGPKRAKKSFSEIVSRLAKR